MTAGDDARTAHEAACALIDERRYRDAVAPAAEACRLRPESGGAWWNYAVVLKQLHRWAECLVACDRTIALDRGDVTGMHCRRATRPGNRSAGSAWRFATSASSIGSGTAWRGGVASAT